MLLVKGNKITFKYESQTRDLLLRISFRIDSRSRIGIVGKNGSGKSTLLKLLLGELRPNSGHLQSSPEVRIGYLKQVQSNNDTLSVSDYVWNANPSLYKIKKRLSLIENTPDNQDWTVFTEYEEAGGYDFEVAIEKNLKEVGLDTSFLERPLQTLSGGEKTKVGLLRILVTEPDILLLDEPTNNLDVSAIQWLKAFLGSSKLPLIVVSHDRSLLDDSVNEIWDLEYGSLKVFSGNYSFLQKTKDQNFQADLEEFELQQKKVEQLSSAASTRRVDANRMENFKKTRSVKNNGGLCKRDEGSGSGSADPTKKMRTAKAVEKRVQLMIEREEAKKPWIEKKRKIILPVSSPCNSKTVLSAKDLCLNYGDRMIFSDLDFYVDRGQRLAIVGENGCGKTSLIKLLHSELSLDHGEIKWAASAAVNTFYQETVDLSDKSTIIQSVWQPEVVEEHIARTVLGSLGLDASIINQKIEHLSPGEKVKTSLAKTILSGANVLVLDEPTNHLEVQAREMLEQALCEYEGTVVFVSHDTAFIERVGTQIFDLSKNQMFRSFTEWENNIKGELR
ncbi:MAG: ABC-F type ribosomal protection protein [Bdellovibrionaceae bacterium]|jgi:ATP-binding cassette, subfamily F, member 3|nr:ABC-F type ribosomal protection protein [Pseudobdellovibrionaceae bacterium]